MYVHSTCTQRWGGTSTSRRVAEEGNPCLASHSWSTILDDTPGRWNSQAGAKEAEVVVIGDSDVGGGVEGVEGSAT